MPGYNVCFPPSILCFLCLRLIGLLFATLPYEYSVASQLKILLPVNVNSYYGIGEICAQVHVFFVFLYECIVANVCCVRTFNCTVIFLVV